MSTSYLAVARTRGVLPVFVAATLGRMSFAMVTLSCIVLLASTTGSYAVAGAAAGALGLANVLIAPWRARLVARRGQRFGLRVLSLGYTVGACALVIVATLGTPTALLIVCAAATGAAAPPVGAAMRMRWRALVDKDHLTRAYSLDAVSEELVFTIGPVLAGLLMAVTIPQTGLLASAALAMIGCFTMTATADPPAMSAPPAGGYFQLRIFRTRGLTSALIITAATGVVIGAIDVIIPAQTAPNDTLSGLLLGAMAFGSGLGGLAYGARNWKTPPRTRLILLTTAMAASCAALFLAPVGVALALGLTITGIALAPAMVTGYLLIDHLINDTDRLEAHTWINTAVNAGAAGAAALGGLALQHTTASYVFLAAGCTGALLITTGTLHQRPKRNETAR